MKSRFAHLTISTQNIRVVAGALEGGITNTVPVAVTVIWAPISSEYIVLVAGAGTIPGNCIVADPVATAQIVRALEGAR